MESLTGQRYRNWLELELCKRICFDLYAPNFMTRPNGRIISGGEAHNLADKLSSLHFLSSPNKYSPLNSTGVHASKSLHEHEGINRSSCSFVHPFWQEGHRNLKLQTSHDFSHRTSQARTILRARVVIYLGKPNGFEKQYLFLSFYI